MDESRSGRIDLVKHKINDHTGDRHVEPQGKSDPRNAAVSCKILPQGAIKCDGNEWHNHDRKDRVRQEDSEIDRADDAHALKACGAVVVVIDEIRSEKKYRNNQRRDLTRAMRDDVSCSDKRVSRYQQDSACRIKTSIEMWQVGDVRRFHRKPQRVF